MEGLVILGIVVGLFFLLARSMRERARAGCGPVRRWNGRRDREAGLHDGTFGEILEAPRSRRL
jgi:hypothetical protein